MKTALNTKAVDPMKAALEAWDGNSRIWSPSKTTPGAYNPKAVVGGLLRVEEWETENGPAQVAILQDEADGQETCVFLNSIVLWKNWENLCPNPGDRVGIAFGGQKDGGNGRPYNVYRVMVERNSKTFPETSTDDAFSDQ